MEAFKQNNGNNYIVLTHARRLKALARLRVTRSMVLTTTEARKRRKAYFGLPPNSIRKRMLVALGKL